MASARPGIALFAAALMSISSVVAGLTGTVHDLSVPGARAGASGAAAAQRCVFCHAPHNANPARALWSATSPGTVYTLYDSSTLEAVLDQPTGASRVCLSCHDGTLALGNQPAAMPRRPGRSTDGVSLGTDLSDDHPVSFLYDSSLALRQGELADPALVRNLLRLDKSGQLQCTACHDPHENPYRKFLRVDDRGGGLCTVCHTLEGWRGSAHATSRATFRGGRSTPWPDSPFDTVADNGCRNCHRSHAAPGPSRLLSQTREQDVCLACHDGSVARQDLRREFAKASAHRLDTGEGAHDPREDPATMPVHVTCADCHDPHGSASGPATAPRVSGRLRGVSGMGISGSKVATATAEYEVCFKCHGARDESTFGIVRDDNLRNVRLEFSQSNPSFHPVASIGRNPAMGGFEPGYNVSSRLYCTDCHNNDNWAATGNRPQGPHGSRYANILEREYVTDDPSPESFQSYALCYKCHNRNLLVNDAAGTFPHDLHVRREEASCAVCHDAHGSRENRYLVNFMRNEPGGRPVVTPSASGRLEFVSQGPGRGQCYLSCHAKNHDPESYP